ncbi:hypothetical protein DEU34_2234 [Microbacterium sp. AG1240]|uniref:hypothetical protein n=1 Tax=Microbacterium sp. AG1240 TaxID=2183992 RepID=UPI000F2D9B78|nr:hypothetical protein [Microbacterium sp. AG1240]RKT33631.1 hypothetical protein DEU34_2234 [Microbacterium sp. AG1240]
MTGSEDASWHRESADEGTVLAPRVDDTFDARIAGVRRARDRRVTEIQVERDEHLRLADELLETQRRVEDDYNTRLGELADAAERAEQP